MNQPKFKDSHDRASLSGSRHVEFLVHMGGYDIWFDQDDPAYSYCLALEDTEEWVNPSSLPLQVVEFCHNHRALCS